MMIAMTDGIDFRSRPGFANERIIGRYSAVILQSNHFAEDSAGRLRIHDAACSAYGDVDQPIESEGEPRAPGLRCIADVQILNIGKSFAAVVCACESERESRAFQRLTVSEVDPFVLGILG